MKIKKENSMLQMTPSITSGTSEIEAISQSEIPQSDIDRKIQMQEAWKAYRGKFDKPLKVSGGQSDDNVISNRCAPIVDKGVSFLFGKTIRIEATEETPKPQSKIQDFIDCLWGDDDEKMTLLSQMAINGGVCGTCFLKLIPPMGDMPHPRIVSLDPLLIRVISDPDDYTLIQAYIIEYATSTDNDYRKRQIIVRIDPDDMASVAGEYDTDDKWIIATYTRKGTTTGWKQQGDYEIWPYPFSPLFNNQNLPSPNEFWGNPDLTQDLIDQNKVLNFIQSNTSRILKFHAHPKTYATGVTMEQINIGIDDLVILPSPDSKINNVEMHSDLKSSIEFASIIRSDMDEQSRVPAVALGRTTELPKGNISGIALELLFQPLVEKTTQKQRLYGSVIKNITRCALVLAELLTIDNYQDYPIDIHWQTLLPNDDLLSAQTALIYQQLGVSDGTLLSRLGFEPEDESDKKEGEQMRAMTNYSRGVGVPPSITTPEVEPQNNNVTGGANGK